MIRRYRYEDYETIARWLSDWGVPCPNRSMLPKIGFMFEGVAVGFLEQPDTDSCYFENVYSNKEATKEERDLAINAIYDAAIKEAEALGFNRMLSTTDHPSMIKRAYQRGSKVEINKVLVITHLNPIKDRLVSPP